MTDEITIGTFNYEHGGLAGDGTIDLKPLIETIARCPTDILMLGECPQWRRDGDRPLWQAVNTLSDLLPEGRYLPFYAAHPGSRNHPMLLVSNAVVRPQQWFDPLAADTSSAARGFLRARVADREMWLSSVHWSGGKGRGEFDRAAALLAPFAARPTIIGGDFNASSSWDREVHPEDWGRAHDDNGTWWKVLQKGRFNDTTGRWELDTSQIDFLRTRLRFRDFGELADDPTPTTHEGRCSARIDRIMASSATPGHLLAGTYRVHRPDDEHAVSDHDHVTATWTFTDQP